MATGGALLADPGWIQVMADALARPVTVSKVRGGVASRRGGCALERLGSRPPRRRSARCSIRGRRGQTHIVRRGNAQQRLYEERRGEH